MKTIRSAATIALDVLVEPRRAFADTHADPATWWWPCGLIVLSTLGFWMVYFATVDSAWLVDRVLAEMGHHLPVEMLRSARRSMNPQVLLFETVAAAIAGLGLRLSVISGYLHLVARLAGDSRTRFLQWLALASWASLPQVFVVAGKALEYALSTGNHVDPDALSITRLAAFVDPPSGSRGLQVLLEYDLTGLWTLALLVVGVHVYRRTGWLSAAAIVVVPWMLLSGARMMLAVA